MRKYRIILLLSCLVFISGKAFTQSITAIPDSICAGDSSLLSAVGINGATYLWSTGATTDSIYVTPFTQTSYTVIITQGVNNYTDSITVYILPNITASIGASSDSICPGNSATLTATAVGGQATYRWSNGATTSSIVVTPVVTTTYTATVYGRCDSVQKTITVNVIPLPTPVISGKDWVCRGMKDTLTVNGPPGTAYLWSNGNTTTSYITGHINADSNFKVYAYNSLGCYDSAIFTIIERLPPVVSITPSLFECAGSPVEIIATAVGSNSPFTFTWSTGATSTSVSMDTIDVNPITTTTYTVIASNGCESSFASTTVTLDNLTMSACCNANIQAGHDTIIVASGTGIKSYTWMPPPVTCLNSLCDSVQVSPTVTTTYTVTGTDSLGCQVQRLITIIVTPSGVPSISDTDFLNVYPNPSSSEFIVELQTKALLKVCDITGRILFSGMENAGTITFGKELKPGMYFLFIDGKPGVKLVKL